jgi:hypothetical protein
MPNEPANGQPSAAPSARRMDKSADETERGLIDTKRSPLKETGDNPREGVPGRKKKFSP